MNEAQRKKFEAELLRLDWPYIDKEQIEVVVNHVLSVSDGWNEAKKFIEDVANHDLQDPDCGDGCLEELQMRATTLLASFSSPPKDSDNKEKV